MKFIERSPEPARRRDGGSLFGVDYSEEESVCSRATIRSRINQSDMLAVESRVGTIFLGSLADSKIHPEDRKGIFSAIPWGKVPRGSWNTATGVSWNMRCGPR